MQSQIFKNVAKFISKNAPTILTVAGVVGVGATAVVTGQATLKAEKALAEKEKEDGERPHGMDFVRTVAPSYIPAIAVGVATSVCILGSNSISRKRNLALASAYLISETAYKEYKDKVVETVGKKKEELIRQDIQKDKVKKNPPKDEEVIQSYEGDTLFYYPNTDGYSYFKATPEHVHRVVNEINYRINQGDLVTINDFNELLGVPGVRYFGDEFGWGITDHSDDLLEVKLTAVKMDDERPCLCIEYGTMPLPLHSDYRYEWWQ